MRTTLTIISLLTLTGCVTTSPIPTSRSMNDFVMMSLKVNNQKSVNYNFISNYVDGQIEVSPEENISGYSKILFSHTIPSTSKGMIQQFLDYRFIPSTTNTDSTNIVGLDIELRELNITYKPLNSTGDVVLVAFIGGELSYLYKTVLSYNVKLRVGEQTYERNFSVNSEQNFISGVGTGTSTSNVYRGEQSQNQLIGKSVDECNNKFLMLLNKYLEENGL